MAKGRLGNSTLPANTPTSVYTAPAGYSASVVITVVNKNNFNAQVSMNICSAGEVSSNILPDSSWIEYFTSIPPFSVLERTGIVVDAGRSIYIQTPNSNLNAVVVGVEEVQ